MSNWLKVFEKWEKEFDKKFPYKNISKTCGRHYRFIPHKKNINLPEKIKRLVKKTLKNQSLNK